MACRFLFKLGPTVFVRVESEPEEGGFVRLIGSSLPHMALCPYGGGKLRLRIPLWRCQDVKEAVLVSVGWYDSIRGYAEVRLRRNRGDWRGTSV